MNTALSLAKIKNRRSERGSRDRSSLATHEEEDPTKTPEPYHCKGHFEADFIELCRQNGLPFTPPIVPRGRPPHCFTPIDGRVEKVRGRQLRTPVEKPNTPSVMEDDLSEPPPKTFVMKDSIEFFKPTIQVEMENVDKPGSVNQIYIRGWKLDEPMMLVFNQCWVCMKKLHTINLWNVGFELETYRIFAETVNSLPHLRNLSLDANNLPNHKLSDLLDGESVVQNISLRHCQITDVGAEQLAESLDIVRNPTTKLVSLNLAGNQITDVGVGHLCKALRLNRTLLVLNLASNSITSKGAIKLAEILSYFPLTEDEVVAKRKLAIKQNDTRQQVQTQPTEKHEAIPRPPSVNKKSSEVDKGKQSKTPKRKDSKSKDTKDEDRSKKKDKDDKKRDKIVGPGDKKSSQPINGHTQTSTDKKKTKKSDENNNPELTSALVDAYYKEDLKCIVAGNKTLISLNLSRNEISESGLASLLTAVKYQDVESNSSRGKGLLRLVVEKNKIQRSSPVLQELREILAKRDPLNKGMNFQTEETIVRE